MEAARSAIQKFTSRHGHRTHVEEAVNPAVTRETIKPTRHEESTEAIDREVHQHHYHTTIQPITHREVLEEKHTHNMLPVVDREFHHGDHEAVKQRVSEEIGQFVNSSVTHETHHTKSVAPAITGEHVHHHVHETVQPVIHKETIQPEVVHTTIPIHEVHHAEAQHHGISSLPMKTLEEFTKIGGVLTGGRTSSHEEYEGAPRPYNKDLSTTVEKALASIHLGGHQHTSPTMAAAAEPAASGRPSTTTTTTTTTSTSGPFTTKTHSKRDSGVDDLNGGRRSQDSAVAGLGSKHTDSPSLKDKLNPRVDANGDGRAGIFS